MDTSTRLFEIDEIQELIDMMEPLDLTLYNLKKRVTEYNESHVNKATKIILDVDNYRRLMAKDPDLRGITYIDGRRKQIELSSGNLDIIVSTIYKGWQILN